MRPRPSMANRAKSASFSGILDDESVDEAELRYQQRKKVKPPKPPVTMDSLKIDLIIMMRKDKASMKTWFQTQQLINLPDKKKKDLVFAGAIVAHLMGRNKTTQALGSDLTKVAGLVFLPFLIPPAVVVGIPTLVLLLPLIAFGWAIVVLNRSAVKVMYSARNARRTQRTSMASRMSTFARQVSRGFSFRKSSTKKKKSVPAIRIRRSPSPPSEDTATITSVNSESSETLTDNRPLKKLKGLRSKSWSPSSSSKKAWPFRSRKRQRKLQRSNTNDFPSLTFDD